MGYKIFIKTVEKKVKKKWGKKLGKIKSKKNPKSGGEKQKGEIKKI